MRTPIDEAFLLAEEERVLALTEGYDPSLDPIPFEEESQEGENISPDRRTFDEARAPKRPGETEDISTLIPDYEAAKAIETRLKTGGYFGPYNVIARWGALKVSKYWDFERRDKSAFGR